MKQQLSLCHRLGSDEKLRLWYSKAKNQWSVKDYEPFVCHVISIRIPVKAKTGAFRPVLLPTHINIGALHSNTTVEMMSTANIWSKALNSCLDLCLLKAEAMLRTISCWQRSNAIVCDQYSKMVKYYEPANKYCASEGVIAIIVPIQFSLTSVCLNKFHNFLI